MDHPHTLNLPAKRSLTIINNWLPTVLVLIAIAFLPLTLIMLSKVEDSIIEEHGQALASTAESVAQRLDRILFERYGDLQSLSQSLVLQNEDERAMTTHLERVQKAYQAFAWLGVVDTHGNILAATVPQTIGLNIANHPLLKNIQRHQALQLQDASPIPFLGNTLGIMYGAPIQVNIHHADPPDQFERIVVFCVSLAYLTQEFEHQAGRYEDHHPDASQVEWHLLRQDGLVLVDSFLGEEGKANLLALDLPSALAANRTKNGYLTERHRRRDVDVLTGYSQLEGLLSFPGFGWRILFRRDLHEVTTEIRNIQIKLGSAGIVVFGPLFGLLIWSTGRNRTNQALLLSSAKQLQKSEEKFRAIVQHAPSGIALIDSTGTTTLSNDLLKSQFGYKKSDLIRLPIEQLLPQRLRTLRKNNPIDDPSSSHVFGLPGSYQGHGVTTAGVEFPVEMEAHLLTTPEGNQMLLSIIDVTERQKIQAEREQMITELEQKNLELERFTYTASHDLRSPVVTIRGFIGSIERDFLQGKYDRIPNDLARIGMAAETMERLLDDLLKFSQAGHILNLPEPVSLGRLAKNIVDLLETPLNNRAITVSIQPHIPEVIGDKLRLYQLLQNLLENAIKFMGDHPHPKIEIGFRQGLDETVFFVQDNGLGIDPRYHQKIFNLFERLNDHIHGTGVGLAWVKRIVELHRGKIWLESEGLGHGTTFAFTLSELGPAQGKE